MIEIIQPIIIQPINFWKVSAYEKYLYLKYICADCISEPGFLGAGNNVQGSDVEKLANWEDCAKKCGRVEACAFWTYDRG